MSLDDEEIMFSEKRSTIKQRKTDEIVTQPAEIQDTL